MAYKICAGLGLTLLGLSMFTPAVPLVLIGVLLVVGGVALLAGF